MKHLILPLAEKGGTFHHTTDIDSAPEIRRKINMKLGLFLMPLHYPERPHADTYEEDLELMEHAPTSSDILRLG